MESIDLLLLALTPFAIAFFLEAIVIYFFKLKRFWASVGFSFFVNLLSLLVLYLGSLLIAALGYEFNGLRLPVPVVLALWWLSVVSDGALLSMFSNAGMRKVYVSSVVMNAISYFFLYFFIINSR